MGGASNGLYSAALTFTVKYDIIEKNGEAHMLYGAIIGDIAGSRFEFNNYRKKDFELFAKNCFFTDDTVMTLAVAKAILQCGGNYSRLQETAALTMREVGRHYPGCGYGGRFNLWMFSDNMPAYHSYGNGSAMRVSAAAYAAESREQAKELARAVTAVTHNHPEGIKGAEAVAVLIYDALHGADMKALRGVAESYYSLNFTIDGIRPSYAFNETCQNTVPQAIEAFLESASFEDAIRIAVSVGGDSDTLAAITGSIAEAYYGVPEDMKKKAEGYLDTRLLNILKEFNKKFAR